MFPGSTAASPDDSLPGVLISRYSTEKVTLIGSHRAVRKANSQSFRAGRLPAAAESAMAGGPRTCYGDGMKFPAFRALPILLLACVTTPAAPPVGETPATPRIAQLDAAVAKEPGNALLLQDRGHALALLGMKDAALADLQRAAALAPDNDKVLNRIAWSYFNLKEYRRALDAWLESARLSGYERYYDYYAVALGYWGVGEPAKAAAFYNTAVEQDETFGEWKTLLTRTESWTWAEKAAIYGLYDAWRLGYRAKEEKKP